MSEETTNNFALVNFPELPASIDNAVKNLTDKPTRNIGEVFADIWFLVFGGLSHAADKRKLEYAHDLEKFRIELESKSETIPPERKMNPSIQVTAQALEDSKFCVQEPILREMFSSLISNSMDSDFQSDVHPSFSGMIKQMSPLDGKILQLFKNGPEEGFPLCDYHLEVSDGSYKVLKDFVFLEDPSLDIDASSKSLSSLLRFGLLDIPPLSMLLPEEGEDDHYQKFKETPLYQDLISMYAPNTISVSTKLIHLTPLGRSFVRVCIPD